MPRDRSYLFALAVGAALASPACAQELGVRWQQDIEAAKVSARQTGRLVLVHVWMDDCGPCQSLEHNVFNQPGVAAAVEAKFVPVKLNANEFPATAHGFGITRVPTDVILTPDGQVIGKLISPATPAAYVADTGQVANQYASHSGQAYENAVALAPQRPVLNQAYADLPIGAQSLPAEPVGPPQSNVDPYASAAQQVDNHYVFPVQPSAPVAATANPPSAPVFPPASSVPPSTPAGWSNPYMPDGSATPAEPSREQQQPQFPPAQVPATVQNTYDPMATANTVSTLPAPNVQQLPPGAPPLAFDGYCPVSMRGAWKWVPGDAKWGAIHRGRTYWFTGPSEQQQFLANPDYYSPALSGVDPVLAIDHRQSVPGLREHSLDYDNQFYMFSSEATLQQFTANPARYAAGVRQAMGLAAGRQVR